MNELVARFYSRGVPQVPHFTMRRTRPTNQRRRQCCGFRCARREFCAVFPRILFRVYTAIYGGVLAMGLVRRFIRKPTFVVWVISLATALLFIVWISQNCIGSLAYSPIKSASLSGVFIYVITPTYARPVQKAELTRLSHVFRLVKDIHWIVVEDAPDKSQLVLRLLEKSGLSFTLLNVPTPAEMKLKPTDRKWTKPRGVLQRNAGLDWLRSESSVQNGVVYFADDDNTYDLDLFDEIRSVKSVGVWPVAFVGEIMVEKPIVGNKHVTGWDVAYKPERPFALDMAGFAVNVNLVKRFPAALFSMDQPVGYQETHILKALHVELGDLEPKADSCTKVLVWHTRTEKVNLIQEKRWNDRGKSSFGGMEV